MGKWFDRFTKFDGMYSLGEWVWAFCRFVGVPSAMIAALTGFSHWYWDAYGLAGVAFAFLVSALVLPLAGILLANAALYGAQAKRSWKGDEPTAATLPQAPDADQELRELIELRFKQSAELSTTVNNLAIKAKDDLSKDFRSLSGVVYQADSRITKIEDTLKPPATSYGLLTLLGQAMTPPQNALEALGRRIESSQAAVESKIDTANNAIHTIRTDLSEVHNSVLTLQRDTYETFRARAAEYDLERCIADINPLSRALYTPSTAPSLPVDWGKWDSGYSEWQSRARAICTIARPYIDVSHEVFTVQSSDHRSQNWSFDKSQFPDESQIMEYKDFCVRRLKLDEAIGKMRHAIFEHSRV